MRKTLGWLLTPWRQLLSRRVQRQHKALIIGAIATISVLYVGSVLFSGQKELDGRSIVGVVVSPDYEQVRAAQQKGYVVEKNSRLCTGTTYDRNPPKQIVVLNSWCISWRAVRQSPANCRTVQTIPPLIPLRPTTTLSRFCQIEWQGDYRRSVVALPAAYKGNTRTDGFEVLGEKAIDLGIWLLTALGVLFAVSLGVATGYQYLRKGND